MSCRYNALSCKNISRKCHVEKIILFFTFIFLGYRLGIKGYTSIRRIVLVLPYQLRPKPPFWSAGHSHRRYYTLFSTPHFCRYHLAAVLIYLHVGKAANQSSERFVSCSTDDYAILEVFAIPTAAFSRFHFVCRKWRSCRKVHAKVWVRTCEFISCFVPNEAFVTRNLANTYAAHVALLT